MFSKIYYVLKSVITNNWTLNEVNLQPRSLADDVRID